MNIKLDSGDDLSGILPKIIFPSSGSPMQILHGKLSYIYALDALYAWQLVKEIRETTGLPSVCSFKKVNPTGVAVGYPLDSRLEQRFQVQHTSLSLLACGLLRSRGNTKEMNHQDVLALSDPLDLPTARLLLSQTVVGLIAPAYEPKALALLKEEKGTNFLILEMDMAYEPDPLETQTIFGFTFQKKRQPKIHWDSFWTLNEGETFENLPHDRLVDASLAVLTLKHSHAHACSLAYRGQIIGIAVGQPSPGAALRQAAEMAKKWMMNQHPRILSMKFPPYFTFNEKESLRSEYIQTQFNESDRYSWMKAFEGITLATNEALNRWEYLQEMARLGVRYIFQPLKKQNHSVKYSQICKEWGIQNFSIDVSFFNH